MTTSPDTRTSDVDTTLREKFNLMWGEAPPSSLKHERREQIWSLFTSEFHQLMNEKREAIEGKRKKIRKDMPRDAQRYWTIHNGVLDDVLSILKD